MKILNPTRLVLGTLLLAGLALTGCLNGEDSKSDVTRISISMGVKDMGKTGGNGLGKSSTIQLKKLIITMTSNGVGDSVIRDTMLADTGAFKSSVSDSQTFSKKFQIKPLRHWTVVVKSLDARDSVIHYDSVEARNVLAGETRNITMNLASRFVMYEVKFALPDSIRSSVTNMAQRILIHRFVLKVDNAIAIDTTVPGAFAPAPAQHSVTFDYIKAGTTPDITLQYFGRAAGAPNDTLLFEKFIPKVKADSTYPTQTAVYVGPGADGKGGATANMVFIIGKVGRKIFDLNVSGLLDW